MSLTTGLPCASLQLHHLQYRSFYLACVLCMLYSRMLRCVHTCTSVHAFGGQGLMLGVLLDLLFIFHSEPQCFTEAGAH